MIEALRHRGFSRLWVGDLISMLGDWLTYVAVGVLAIEHGGALAVLGVLLAHTLPRVLVAPWAGRVADRYDRRAVLVVGSAVRGATVLAMAAAAVMPSPAWVQGLLMARMAAGAFVDAAAAAAVPRLVPATRLAGAHALLGTTWSVVFGVGVAAGGLVSAGVGPVGALVVDALTFFVAALVYAGLPRLHPSPSPSPSPSSGPGPARASGGFGEALWFMRRRPWLLRVALAKLPVMIANGGAFVLVHAIAGRSSGADVALTLGTLHLLRALGSGLGPVVWVRVAALRGTELGLRAATALVLLGVVVFGLAEGEVWLGIGALAWGAGVGSHWATAATRLQRLTPDALRGRLSAVDLVAHTLGQGVGGVLGALGLALALAPGLAVGLTVSLAMATWVGLEREARGVGRASA